MSAVDKTDQGGVRRCQKKGAVLNGGGGGEEDKICAMT